MLVDSEVATERWERIGGWSEVGWVPGRWWARPSTQQEDRRLVAPFDKDQGCEREHVDVAHGLVDIEEGTPYLRVVIVDLVTLQGTAPIQWIDLKVAT